MFSYMYVQYHHSCRSHATKTAFISSTTLRCLSIHPRCSARDFNELVSISLFFMFLLIAVFIADTLGGHVVVVRLVAASREPVSEGGQLASSKDVLSSGDSF